MSIPATLHRGATATHFGALRIWVFGMWFADIVITYHAKDVATWLQ